MEGDIGKSHITNTPSTHFVSKSSQQIRLSEREGQAWKGKDSD